MAIVREQKIWVGMTGKRTHEGTRLYLIVADTLKEAVQAAPDDVVSISPHSFIDGNNAVAVIIAD